jgi:hypothetical protein
VIAVCTVDREDMAQSVDFSRWTAEPSEHPLTLCAEGSYDVVSTWRLPNVKCSRCVLQWRYTTAHMCQ